MKTLHLFIEIWGNSNSYQNIDIFFFLEMMTKVKAEIDINVNKSPSNPLEFYTEN